MPLPVYIVILCTFILTACNTQQDEALVYNGETMGTSYSITIPASEEHANLVSQADIEDLLETINRSMSTYLPDSELSRLNRNDSTDWQPVSEDLFRVLSAAQTVNAQTGGAFDVTIGRIVNLWGFGPGNSQQIIPDEGEIMTGLRNTGHEYLSMRENPRGIKKEIGEIYLDLSAIAKGYAVDRISELMEKQGIQNYLVEIGGEIRAKGHNQRGETWRIGIEKPLVEGREIQRIIALENLSMATSGDYRNFFEYEGERYSHTIDPATGSPVKHRDMSVTVFHESAMFADALATALTVMGTARGLAFANEHDLAVLYILRNDGTYSETYTPAFSRTLNR